MPRGGTSAPVATWKTRAGGAFGAVLAGAAGLGRAESRQLARAGALVGSRRFGQSAELEADALCTRIAARAGYDPLRGALFFSRLPARGTGSSAPNRPTPAAWTSCAAWRRSSEAGAARRCGG